MAGNNQGWKDESPESEIKKDRERQLNALIGLSDRLGDFLANAFAKGGAIGVPTCLHPHRSRRRFAHHTSGKSSVVPICLAPLKAKHFR